MHEDDPTLAELVAAAATGDAAAWDSLVSRFTPLVLSVTARFRLGSTDAADVSQTLWLRLLQNLRNLREPAALPGWIATTTRNECLQVVTSRRRLTSYDPLDESTVGRLEQADATSHDVAADLLRAERHAALLAAFGELSDRHRELLLLLVQDPPLSYAEISDRLGMPIGAIGPTRARAVERLRQSPTLAALQDSDLPTDTVIGKRTG